MAATEEAAWEAGARLLVTDELGMVKAVEAKSPTDWKGNRPTARWGNPDRSLAINSMCLSSRGGLDDPDSATLVVSRGSAGYEVLDPHTGQLQTRVQNPEKSDRVAGTAVVWRETGARQVLSALESGYLRLHAEPSDSATQEWTEVRSWRVSQQCDCLALHSGMELAAVGGQGSEVAVWDINSQQQIFQAKGAKKDVLGLQDRPWVSALAWMSGGDSRKVLVGTGSSKLRLYDLAAGQRRPVLETNFEKQTRVSTISPCYSGLSAWASNGLGIVQRWDLTANRMMEVLKGPGGSVRSIAVHPTEPVIASVGLDRWLRVHSTVTQKQLAKVYLKQHLTGVAWCPLVAQEQKALPEPEHPESRKREKISKPKKREEKPKRVRLKASH